MEFNEQDIKDILAGLADIKERLVRMETIQGQPSPACALHSERIEALGRRMDKAEEKLSHVQTVIGKKELIVAAFGAIGVGLGFAIKAVVAMAKG